MAKKKKSKETTYAIERTPVVAVMGHVDHGKTSLLDAIRGTDVAAGEAGGITQNTRAHQISRNEQKITFIDTPGHEAFTQMRSRGATVTDIVLLVVAADDGVQPQTKESIDFALESKVPVVVAINKIDLPGKNLNKLKQELTSAGLQLEEYGGDVIVNEVSAIKEEGLEELLESILTVAELQELKKDEPKDVKATAFILEAVMEKTLGSVNLMLVKSGTFKERDFLVHENGYDRIRALLDESQNKLDGAEQGDPVSVIGVKDVLQTGEYVNIVENEKQAKALFKTVQEDASKLIEADASAEAKADDDDENNLDLLADLLGAAQEEEEIKFLNVVVKTDSKGTLEVVEKELKKLDDEEVQIKIIDSAVGPITEKDLMTAKTSQAIIIGFQTEVMKKVPDLARKDRVLVRNYSVIYELIEELDEAMNSMADPVEEKVEVARAKVKQVFTLSNGKKVAGCEVTSGTVTKGYRAYVEHDGEEGENGKITSLKHLKKEVKEIKKGQECGILLDPDPKTIEEGDFIVCYKVEII